MSVVEIEVEVEVELEKYSQLPLKTWTHQLKNSSTKQLLDTISLLLLLCWNHYNWMVMSFFEIEIEVEVELENICSPNTEYYQLKTATYSSQKYPLLLNLQ